MPEKLLPLKPLPVEAAEPRKKRKPIIGKKFVIAILLLLWLGTLLVVSPQPRIGLVSTTEIEKGVVITYPIRNSGVSVITSATLYIAVDRTLVDDVPPSINKKATPVVEVPPAKWGEIGFTGLDSRLYSVVAVDVGWLLPTYIPLKNSRSVKITIAVGEGALRTKVGPAVLVASNYAGQTTTIIYPEIEVTYRRAPTLF